MPTVNFSITVKWELIIISLYTCYLDNILQDANLNLIKTLKEKYNCNVGYSGHETGLAISYATAALGVSSLERHITLDRAMYGSDQSASLEPSGLRQLVGGVRKIDLAMGDGEKKILEQEVPIAEKLRAHLS